MFKATMVIMTVLCLFTTVHMGIKDKATALLEEGEVCVDTYVSTQLNPFDDSFDTVFSEFRIVREHYYPDEDCTTLKEAGDSIRDQYEATKGYFVAKKTSLEEWLETFIEEDQT